MRQILFSFLTAVQFLTTLPVSLWREVKGEDIARSVRYFPVVGGLLGILLAGVNSLLSAVFPSSIIAPALVISLLVFTGALHFDGFLDSCDGLFGYHTVERRLEIMRDSRVGSFAVAGGWALLSLKAAALWQMPPGLLIQALLLGPVLGRWALVCAVVIFPYGRPSGLGTVYKQYNSRRELVIGSLGVVVLAAIVLRGPGVLLAIGILALTWLMGRWIMSKLPAGLTGDSYGAIAEVMELATWLGIVATADVVKSWL